MLEYASESAHRQNNSGKLAIVGLAGMLAVGAIKLITDPPELRSSISSASFLSRSPEKARQEEERQIERTKLYLRSIVMHQFSETIRTDEELRENIRLEARRQCISVQQLLTQDPPLRMCVTDAVTQIVYEKYKAEERLPNLERVVFSELSDAAATKDCKETIRLEILSLMRDLFHGNKPKIVM